MPPAAKKPTEDTATTPQEQTPDEPTREDIFSAALVVARHTNLVPTFLGPTASGKTYGVQHMAEANNAEVVTVLLGQHTPDEIAGFQLAINDKLVIQMPFWFKEAQDILDRGKNAWILFDELGLSREETRGALYTFMRDRHLHGHTLNTSGANQSVLVFAASNAATFAPPFKTRCLFLSVPSDRSYLQAIASGSDFASKVVRLAPIHYDKDPFWSNEPPPEPIVMHSASTKALVDLSVEREFWRLTEPARYAILSGLVPHQTLAAVLKESVLDISVLAKNWQELERALHALPTDKRLTMINNVIETLPQLEKEERAEALMAILNVLYDDLTGESLQTYFSTNHSEQAAEAALEIDPEYLEKRLKERGLLWIETKGKIHNAVGTLRERIEVMVQNTNEATASS